MKLLSWTHYVCASFKRSRFSSLSFSLDLAISAIPLTISFSLFLDFYFRPVSCTLPFFSEGYEDDGTWDDPYASNPYFFVINFGCGPTDLRSRRGGLSSNNEAASPLQHKIQGRQARKYYRLRNFPITDILIIRLSNIYPRIKIRYADFLCVLINISVSI
jgi:hypothetical protein